MQGYGAKIRWGTNVAQVMDKAETVDPLTVKVTLTVPAPRFFWLLTYHFDIGVYMMPKHIFEGKTSPPSTTSTSPRGGR